MELYHVTFVLISSILILCVSSFLFLPIYASHFLYPFPLYLSTPPPHSFVSLSLSICMYVCMYIFIYRSIFHTISPSNFLSKPLSLSLLSLPRSLIFIYSFPLSLFPSHSSFFFGVHLGQNFQ
jgi:hypothetical protein